MRAEAAAVRPVTAVEVRPLRRAVLRPHQEPEDCVYPLDDLPATGHFGAFVEGALVGVASIFQEAREGEDPGAWRIRGMATLPQVRGDGWGAKLLTACLDHARESGGSHVWCNARSTAAGFYRKQGFREDGPEFDLPGLGPHYVMVVEL